EKCNKQLAVALMDLHDCLMESQIMKALDAQKAELERQSDDEASAKRKEKSTEPQPKKTKKEKKAKDPSKPKRPPTAFFLFMDDFRKSYKEANPDCKSVSVVAKEGGERWKSMADEEKMAYVARAAELKAEYGKALNPDNADDGKGSLEMEVKVDIWTMNLAYPIVFMDVGMLKKHCSFEFSASQCSCCFGFLNAG
ncbi:hypothetical protein C3L33_13798, partial [Rhododendron williamsianum]